MRVLLLQEMSGVHTELRAGLLELGVDVSIATLGDGTKDYGTDIYLGNSEVSKSASIDRVLTQLGKVKLLRSFDVIQTISPNPFHKIIAPLMERLVFNEDKKLIYVAAGSDPIYRMHVKNLDYWPPHDWFKNENLYAKFRKLMARFNHIVPVCWEYEFAMKKDGFLPESVIPFPIDISKHYVKTNSVKNKLKIFHPLNRRSWRKYDFKGTSLILQAFEELEHKYADKVDFISEGGMNHKDYDTLTNSVDIIVDQVYSQTYGMSAAYGLAKGKVVLSGLEEISKNGFYSECPIINITPNLDHIKNELELLINNRELVENLGLRSRSFAEKYHDHKVVAQKYLDIYSR